MRDDLRTAYAMKERAEFLLSKLDKLKAEGSITDTEYQTLKAEYISMLNDALPWIDSIKAELQKELDGWEKELEKLEQQLSLLRARLKVGEITSETYRETGKPLEGKVKSLQDRMFQLQTLISSTSSADIGGPKDISIPKSKGEGRWTHTLKRLQGTMYSLFFKLRGIANRIGPARLVALIIGFAGLIAVILLVATFIPQSHQYKIVYIWGKDERALVGEQAFIHVMNADGSKQHRLDNLAADDLWDDVLIFPSWSWSPSGSKIAFSYNYDLLFYDPLCNYNMAKSGLIPHDIKLGIYIINSDGTKQEWLTYGGSPVWSPDGKQIAFIDQYDGDDSRFSCTLQVYVISADGKNRKRLTQH